MFGSRSKPKPKLEPRCRHCRAPNDLDAPECWLCQRRQWRETGLRSREDPPLPERSPFATIAGLPGPARTAPGRPARCRRPARPTAGTTQESTGGLVWFALIYAATWLVNLWPRSAPAESLSLALIAVAFVAYFIFSLWRRQ
jgi:hypothetical protein